MLWVAIALGWYLAASVIASVANWIDKRRAMHGHRRLPEKTLHMLELIGGWPGAIATQWAIRHKTSKTSYRVVLWAIVALHVAAWIGAGMIWWRLRA